MIIVHLFLRDQKTRRGTSFSNKNQFENSLNFVLVCSKKFFQRESVKY